MRIYYFYQKGTLGDLKCKFWDHSRMARIWLTHWVIERILRNRNNMGSIHGNSGTCADVSMSINECHSVIRMQHIIHWAINVHVGGKGEAICALNGSCIMNMPNAGVVGMGCHNPLSFGKPKKTHQCKWRHHGWRGGQITTTLTGGHTGGDNIYGVHQAGENPFVGWNRTNIVHYK